MRKNFLVTGSVFILIGVILGALGAHALKEALTPEQLASFETGVRYQIYHGFALLIMSLIDQATATHKKTVYYLFTIGTIFFSFSIYLLSLQEILGITLKFLGPITPIGGLLLIIGWAVNVYNFLKLKR
ncbi:DUF423 domain-containing protein [Nonlabens tegetincola]|uniref:DUF423 domain-containing protein n=1 Tax=Nonlabens tegetincola TaxID=323273 RepID=UPI000CF370B9|nr:DUF423 domain-containing protein [Nonlabens tegetincola]PQJ18989.1 hypothetical protein BST93_04200 [Nonlabens tegetincola]